MPSRRLSLSSLSFLLFSLSSLPLSLFLFDYQSHWAVERVRYNRLLSLPFHYPLSLSFDSLPSLSPSPSSSLSTSSLSPLFPPSTFEEFLKRKCPLVYVYPLPPSLSSLLFSSLGSEYAQNTDSTGETKQFFDLEKSVNVTSDHSFPFPNSLRHTQSSSLYAHSQYSLAEIFLERLLTSVCHTRDPHHADLYWVPISIRGKPHQIWQQECRRLQALNISSYLTYLNETTASSHFFVVGKRHTSLTECTDWFASPRSHLRPSIRVTYSQITHPADVALYHHIMGNDQQSGEKREREILEKGIGEVERMSNVLRDARTYPNLIAIPPPASFRLSQSRDAPWSVTANRTRLFLFLRFPSSIRSDSQVLRRIITQCDKEKERDPSICSVLPYSLTNLEEKKNTIFCLHLSSHSLYRRDIFDSIAMGCIPVFFGVPVIDEMVPLFRPYSMRIVVPEIPFLNNQLLLRSLFESIPRDFLHKIQQNLHTNAKRFQYSEVDDPGDAFDTTLQLIHEMAKIIRNQTKMK
jgi:hypothetical protein